MPDQVKKIRIRGKLVDKKTGVGLEGKVIRIADETGVLSAETVTGAGGTFHVEFDPPDRTTDKDYSFIISYPGDDYFATQSIGHFVHVPAAVREQVTTGGASIETMKEIGVSTGVEEKRPITSLSLEASGIPDKLQILCKAVLTADGQPLAFREITFSANSYEATGMTNEKGEATGVVTVPVPGDYSIIAKFRGDPKLPGCVSNIVKVAVKPPRKPTKLTITKYTIGPGIVTVEGTLTSDAVPVPNAIITVKVSTTQDSRQVTTDANGYFKVEGLKIVEGNNSIIANFEGDSEYYGNSDAVSISAYRYVIAADVPPYVVKISKGEVRELTAVYKGREYNLLGGEPLIIWPGETYEVWVKVWAPLTKYSAAWETVLMDGTEVLASFTFAGGEYKSLMIREICTKPRELKVILRVPGQSDP
jgi:hypothetical protein